MDCRSNQPFFHWLAKRLHSNHGAQRHAISYRIGSSRCCYRGGQGTTDWTSPGCCTYSHDGACCSRIMHQSVHDLENSITSETALLPVEAATAFPPALLGRESANHPRCSYSYFGLGRISLPSLHLPFGRIKNSLLIAYRKGSPRYWQLGCSRSIEPPSSQLEGLVRDGRGTFYRV